DARLAFTTGTLVWIAKTYDEGIVVRGADVRRAANEYEDRYQADDNWSWDDHVSARAQFARDLSKRFVGCGVKVEPIGQEAGCEVSLDKLAKEFAHAVGVVGHAEIEISVDAAAEARGGGDAAVLAQRHVFGVRSGLMKLGAKADEIDILSQEQLEDTRDR